MTPALSVRGVHASHPGVPVLHGVDLEVPAGAIVAVLGGSGCGKTTLLRAIAGFHPVDAGSVHLAGRLVAGDGVDVPPERRGVGLVPQDGALFGHLTVAGNVAFGLPRGPRRHDRVAEVVFRMRLSPQVNMPQQQAARPPQQPAPAGAGGAARPTGGFGGIVGPGLG